MRVSSNYVDKHMKGTSTLTTPCDSLTCQARCNTVGRSQYLPWHLDLPWLVAVGFQSADYDVLMLPPSIIIESFYYSSFCVCPGAVHATLSEWGAPAIEA